LEDPGTPLGVQFPAVDQFPLTPPLVQTFKGLNGGDVPIVIVKKFVVGRILTPGGLLVSATTVTT